MRFFKGDKQPKPNSGNWHRSALLLAMSSSIAILFTHPLDVVRVQMQSQFMYISPAQILRQIVKYRGLQGIYYGLLTAVQREFIYCLLRFSFYEKARSRGLVENFWRKMQYAGPSGYFAGLISTPLTKVAVRIRTDAAKPPCMRYDYSNVFHGLWNLHNEGGFKNFYNMWSTCALRGMFITICQLSIYYQVKEALLQQNSIKFRSDWECFFLASPIAGGITALALTPIDMVETIGHNTHAKNFIGDRSIVQRLNQLYGWHGFYRGLMANLLRLPPHTILTFLIYEQMNWIFLTEG